MTALARLLIHLSALLAPRADRARLKEEWLAELDAVSTRGSGAALRFALGAPAGAWCTRESSRLLSAVTGDAKYAWRQLVRRPAHTLSVVACLVAGLVVSIGMFSALDSMIVGDLPGVHDRRSMSRLHLTYDTADVGKGVSHRESSDELTLDEFRGLERELRQSNAIGAVGAEGYVRVTITGNHGPVAALGQFASGDYFKVLATERGPAGRLLQPSDDEPNGPAVAVIGEHFWRTQLDARPEAVGQTILVAGVSLTIVGVAPARFHGLQPDDINGDDSRGSQIWIPLAMAQQWPTQRSTDAQWLTPAIRLKPGRTTRDADADLAIPSGQIAAAFPSERANARLLVRSEAFGPDMSLGEVATALFLMMLLPMTILAIGCANVANLQLARVAERSRELAVRLSLGASRIQLIRLLTLETLARVSAAVVISLAIVRALMTYFQPYFPVALSIDWRVVLFAVSLALLVALGTGLMPAWMVLRKTAAGQLKQSAQSGGLGHSRMRALLIVMQVALSLALLTTSTLIVRTINQMAALAPAVLREQVTASFNPGTTGMSPAEGRRFADTLAERAAADGRVRGVALSWTWGLDFGGPQTADNGTIRFQRADLMGVSPSWFEVMDVKLLTGRRLTNADDDSVALLSARAAEMVAPSGSAVGEVVTLQLDPKTTRQVRIVGIVADNPTNPRATRPEPVIYTAFPKTFTGVFDIHIRTSATDAISTALPKLATSIDPRIPWAAARRGDVRFEESAREVGMIAVAIGAAGTVALVLSATGLFAVMSYIVMLRRREIGVRLAIGADPTRIVALVMRQAIRLVAIGATAGMAVAVPVAFLMRSEFAASVKPTDPMIFAPALLLLFVVGAIAAAVPALRASGVDPISTLRQD